MTIGLLLITLIALVPLVGWVIKLAATMAGLGAFLLTRFGTREGIGFGPPVAAVAPSRELD